MQEAQKGDLIKQRETIELVGNLTRYLGKRSKDKLLFTWECEGLAVIVNDDYRHTIAMYDDTAVCSNLFDPPLFVPGPWLDIVHRLHDQIRADRLCIEWEKVNGVPCPAPGEISHA